VLFITGITEIALNFPEPHNLLNTPLVLIPLYIDEIKHYTLVAITIPSTLTYYDSLHSSKADHLGMITEGLQRITGKRDFTQEYAKALKQTTVNDCGAIVMLTAKKLVKGESVPSKNIPQSEIIINRRELAKDMIDKGYELEQFA